MRQKPILIALFAAMAALFVTSCDKRDDTIPVNELTERKDIALTRSQMDFVKSNNKFAIDFFNKVADKKNGESMLVSPISVTFALGMVNNGATGDTQKEINAALGYEGDSMEDLNAFCKTMLEQTSKIDPSTTLQLANMAVINKGFVPLKDGFTKDVQDNYEANVCYKDFGKEDVMTFINQWCEEKTGGMIKNFLTTPPDPQEFAHFLNATYFKGIWTSKFKKNDSKNEKFTKDDGGTVTVNMMRQKSKFNCCFIGDIGRAVTLPYGNQAFRMTLILPENGKNLTDLREALDRELWDKIHSSQWGREADVRIPSFETEFGTESIKSVLKDMGIEKAFDPYAADFSRMTDLKQVCIGDVLHKTKIKVDEQGSEAAAVTDVVIMYGAGPNVVAPEIPLFEFHADHPFLYVISEVSTGAIFFMGQFTGK